MEVRETLSYYEFPGDQISVVSGSASIASESLTENPDPLKGVNKWVNKIYDLMDQVNFYIPTPKRKTDKPFLTAAEDFYFPLRIVEL